jgi:hypothetical protein
MRQIIYVMQFTGQATPAPSATNTLKARTTAPSCGIHTAIGPQGVNAIWGEIDGGGASFESDVTITGENSFLESGTIRFGKGNALRFSTVGQGYIAPAADAALRHGTVTWRAERGEGQFEGASGLITSNFTIDGGGRVVDNHFGVLFVA